MTVKEAIDLARNLKQVTEDPYTNAIMLQYLNEIEGKVQTEVLKINPKDLVSYTEEDYTKDSSTTLIVTPPHDKIYYQYLMAMIDYMNGEYNKYNSTITVVNDYLQEWRNWLGRNYQHPVYLPGGFYISAYGLAVKHGYTGTEAEWVTAVNAAMVAAEAARDEAKIYAASSGSSSEAAKKLLSEMQEYADEAAKSETNAATSERNTKEFQKLADDGASWSLKYAVGASLTSKYLGNLGTLTIDATKSTLVYFQTSDGSTLTDITMDYQTTSGVYSSWQLSSPTYYLKEDLTEYDDIASTVTFTNNCGTAVYVRYVTYDAKDADNSKYYSVDSKKQGKIAKHYAAVSQNYADGSNYYITTVLPNVGLNISVDTLPSDTIHFISRMNDATVYYELRDIDGNAISSTTINAVMGTEYEISVDPTTVFSVFIQNQSGSGTYAIEVYSGKSEGASSYTAGYGISISEDKVISVTFADGDEVSY